MSVQQVKFKEIADAIREKTNGTDKIKPSEFASKVNEVYEAGVKSVVIQGEKSGEVVTITDVSPYEHEMSVKVRSKNLLNLTSIIGKSVTASGGTLSCGADGGITGSGMPTGYLSFSNIFLDLPMGIYTLSASGDGTNIACGLTIRDTDGQTLLTDALSSKGKKVFNLADYPSHDGKVIISIKRNKDNAEISGTMYFQIEEGATASDYTPCIADMTTVNVNVYTENEKVGTYPANADGIVEGVTSHYPTTILSADKSGVIIDCTYNRDIDKVVEISIEEGKKSEHDRFWDDYQQNGNRTLYGNAFGVCWTANNFCPKYPMRPTGAYMMFFTNQSGGIEIDDFVAFCEENNVVLDFSQCTNAEYALASLHTYHHGVLDFSKCTSMSNLFYSHNRVTRSVETIDEWISSETTVYHTTTFQYAINLTNIKVSGVIAKNIDFSKCTKLTHDSLMSILNAGRNCILNLGTANLEKLSVEEKAIAIEKGCTLI